MHLAYYRELSRFEAGPGPRISSPLSNDIEINERKTKLASRGADGAGAKRHGTERNGTRWHENHSGETGVAELRACKLKCVRAATECGGMRVITASLGRIRSEWVERRRARERERERGVKGSVRGDRATC